MHINYVQIGPLYTSRGPLLAKHLSIFFKYERARNPVSERKFVASDIFVHLPPGCKKVWNNMDMLGNALVGDFCDFMYC